MEKKFTVYEHLFPNGKRYFGITCKSPNARWEGGTGYDKIGQPVMYNAIQKYGWNNIQHNILFEELTFEEATAKERELIAQFKTNCTRYGNKYGYNMTDGGEGSPGHKGGEKVSKTNRERLLGKRGKDCPNSEPVVCDGIEYESLTQFKEMNNHPRGNITGWLNGKVGMPLEWYEKGLCYKRLGPDITFPQESPHYYQIEYNNKIYESQAALADELGVAPASIVHWLKHDKFPPKRIVEKGLRRVGEEYLTKYQEKPVKTKVVYDGMIFESQRSLAKYLDVKPGTLNAWLKGKNPMPEEYKSKGLNYIE